MHTDLLVHTDLLAGISLLAALLLLAGLLAAMRADSLFIRRRLEGEAASRRLWAHGLADASFDGLLIHRQGVILLMNRALVRMLGLREREWLGQNFCTVAHEEDVAALRAELEAPGPELTRFRLLRASRGEIMAELSSQAIEFEGQPATVTALRDITQRLADEVQIERLTNHDALTGLPNRSHFEDITEEALAASQPHQPLSLLITDIDDFKGVNQQFGRRIGDALLQQVAQRFAGLLLQEDVLARLSGGKFALLLKAEGPPSRGMSLSGQLLASCAEPFIIDGRLVSLKLYAGLALFPDHAVDMDGLIRAAETALDRAQESGGGVHLFRHEDNSPARPALAATSRPADTGNLRDDLRHALGRGDIRLLYQPAFSLPELSLYGFEASARWQHPSQGLLRPDQFMTIAEAAGLAQELGSQLIERACAEAVAASVPRLAINLSPVQFRDAQLPARLAAILRKTGLPPGALELEVTEAMLADHADYAAGLLHALRNSGLVIALDDFGAGSAPLGALCHLPLARLKIGQRFIQKLGIDRNAEAMLSATLSLAANLHMQVTALGVETEAQLEMLRSHGCHVVQGPLLGDPASRAVARPLALTSTGVNLSAS
jgi:diguanylate cyclase